MVPKGRGRRPNLRLLVLIVLVAGCGSGADRTTSGAPRLTSSTAKPAVRPTTTTTTTTTTTAVPAFASSSSTVTASQLGATWHAGCPVEPGQLRLLQMRYWGFDGQAHTGSMVVNVSAVASVVQVFSVLYDDRFPIAEMVPLSAFGGDDNAAAAADNTSGFNCRDAVAPGPPQWSMHAYGEAVDVNDVQNPYVAGATVIPPEATTYVNRSDVRPGMAVAGGVLVSAFATVGWQWGGRWTVYPDYQHFSINGR